MLMIDMMLKTVYGWYATRRRGARVLAWRIYVPGVIRPPAVA
jgi:hypothetical protein